MPGNTITSSGVVRGPTPGGLESCAPDPQRFDDFAEEYDFAITCRRDHSFFVERIPERRRTALDVGCGSGGLVEVIAPFFDFARGVEHLVSDRYFTEPQFRARYGEALPGARMQKHGVFMQLEWNAPPLLTEEVT